MKEEEEEWEVQPTLIEIYWILSSWINKGSTPNKKNIKLFSCY